MHSTTCTNYQCTRSARNPGNPGILGILGILGLSIWRRSRNRHVAPGPSRCSLRASLRIRAPCSSQASSLASTSSLDTAELSSANHSMVCVPLFGVALLALEVSQHPILDVRAHILLRDASVLHVDRVLAVEVAASPWWKLCVFHALPGLGQPFGQQGRPGRHSSATFGQSAYSPSPHSGHTSLSLYAA